MSTPNNQVMSQNLNVSLYAKVCPHLIPYEHDFSGLTDNSIKLYINIFYKYTGLYYKPINFRKCPQLTNP